MTQVNSFKSIQNQTHNLHQIWSAPSLCSRSQWLHPKLPTPLSSHFHPFLSVSHCSQCLCHSSQGPHQEPAEFCLLSRVPCPLYKQKHLLFVFYWSIVALWCVSTVQQSWSVTCIHTSPLFWISFPFRSHRTISRDLCAIQQVFISYLF